MPNEILVAVDGSKPSDKIVEVACVLAKNLSTGILLVYVMNVPAEQPEGLREYEKEEDYPDAYVDYLRDIGEEATSKYTDIIQKAGVPVRSVTPSGNPGNEILNLADFEQPRMIVVGVRGRHGISRFRTLGSVARNVIENSKIPVLSVPLADSK